MSRAFRKLKNWTGAYSNVEIQVRNATSNEPRGPTLSEMREIALLSHHEKYLLEIERVLTSRLNERGKNWRCIAKALTIIMYCMQEGSDALIDWLRQNSFLISTLREFRYIDEKKVDQGGPIRTKSIKLAELLLDNDKLEAAREEYRFVSEQMARPGIVRSSQEMMARHTFDISSTSARGDNSPLRSTSFDEVSRSVDVPRSSMSQFPLTVIREDD